MSKKIILTGLRANSEFHIGNYLGAILPMVDMQKKHAGQYQINMFIPDLHSFTTPIDHTKLYPQVIKSLRTFVAAGLDITDADTHIYRQSFVPAHSELAWILDCFTHFGEASRMIEFKDKSAKFGSETVSMGQFNYPVLMAADILLYGATYVPLGDDQKQHLELTRDLAIRLNNKFERELFVVPVPWAKQLEFTDRTSIRIMSLRNPEKKMSKSVDDPNGTIMMDDTPEAAAKKIMTAETDSIGVINYDVDNQPGITNLLQIYQLISGKTEQEVSERWVGKTSYGDFKTAVAKIVQDFLADFQKNLAKIDEQQIMDKLLQSEYSMNKVANKTLAKVQKAVGLRDNKKTDKRRAATYQKPKVVEFTDFANLDIRVGTVIAAEKVESSDKLIKLQIDMGLDTRQILTGMQEFYEPEYFIGKQVPILLNLEPREMMGHKSEGMLLAYQTPEKPVFLLPAEPLSNGAELE